MKSIRTLLCLSAFYLALFVNADGCRDSLWWKNTVIYQILVPSFKDGNVGSKSSGVGNLKGIIQKIDYIKELGVETIWLTPFYAGPNGDIGYDISNHTEVGKDFGTMEDFNQLLKVVHDKGMKLIIEFVPNHSSDKHDWFEKSYKKIDPYTDYYVWKNKTAEGGLPSNWLSKRSGSMWKFHNHRQQYYLHQFLDELPDLNYRNKDLTKEMDDILEFWLKKGVDGFGMDSILKLYEDEALTNEPKIDGTTLSDSDPNAYNHIYTIDQPETYEQLYHWRTILDKYSNITKDTPQKIILTEAYSPSLEKIGKYFGNGEKQGTHLSVNYELMNKFLPESSALDLEKIINNYIKTLPSGKWPSWMVGGHSVKRIASRYGSEMVDAMNMLTLLLPGTAVTFAGDELGMEGPFIRYEDQKDPEGFLYGKENYQKVCRDGSRTPFQWSSDDNAGFSTVKSWLPVHPNYYQLNAEVQKKAKKSHLTVYKELAALRMKSSAVLSENMTISTPSDYVFIMTRSFKDSAVIVIINLNSRSETVDVSEFAINASDLSIYTSSVNAGLENKKLKSTDGKIMIDLRPKASVVLTKNNPNNCPSGSPAIVLLSLPVVLTCLLAIFWL